MRKINNCRHHFPPTNSNDFLEYHHFLYIFLSCATSSVQTNHFPACNFLLCWRLLKIINSLVLAWKWRAVWRYGKLFGKLCIMMGLFLWWLNEFWRCFAFWIFWEGGLSFNWKGFDFLWIVICGIIIKWESKAWS